VAEHPRCGKLMTAYETPGAAVPDKYAYGPVIRRARLAAGMTQQQLAGKIGVASRNVVAAWENGRAWPRKASVLEEVLGVRLGGPVCGLPEGHAGPCRSQRALAGYYRQAARRVAAARARGRRYGQARSEAA
jgi:transcriptional regulator with XRE-family HTH domain